LLQRSVDDRGHRAHAGASHRTAGLMARAWLFRSDCPAGDEAADAEDRARAGGSRHHCFGVNDATSYRSPSAFADDLAALVAAARQRVGEAAVVIAGVAPLTSFPALPWPLRPILGWRTAALQAAADRLAARLPKLAVERFAAPPGPELFAEDGFHPNPRAHALWGERIAALALPLVA
jgi:GDSL-like Lipase/Acylhydrolase family